MPKTVKYYLGMYANNVVIAVARMFVMNIMYLKIIYLNPNKINVRSGQLVKLLYMLFRSLYCNSITQQCHKDNPIPEKHLRGFERKCMRDDDCRPPLTCIQRTHRKTWKEPKGWCDTRGLKGDPCELKYVRGRRNTGRGNIVARHEQCRYKRAIYFSLF